jgi:hypothetical protein
MYEETSDAFWAEPVASIYSDPLHILLAAECEDDEDLDLDADHMTLRGQYALRDEFSRVSDLAQFVSTERQAATLSNATRKAILMWRRAGKSFEEQIQLLERMGVDNLDAVDLILSVE